MQRAQTNNTTYDFGDGNGSVPAHQHRNGGGWVANTAYVDDTAYIGINARVFGYASIRNKAHIGERAEISGYATVKDNAIVKGYAAIIGSCTVKDQAHIAGSVFMAGNIEIGGDKVFNEQQCFFNTHDCLSCPALLGDNYTARNYDPCMYCMEKSKVNEQSRAPSRDTTIWSWLPQKWGINQNKEKEAYSPQAGRTDNKFA